MLDLYDRRIRDAKTDDYRDIANAAALLYRLDARGIGVGRRWTELADLAERRVNDQTLAFAQLHYLLCLIGDDRWEAAYRLFAAMDLDARGGQGTQARLLDRLGVSLAKTMLSSLDVTRSDAALPARMRGRDLAALGGSHAQRQTFELLLRAAERRERRAAQSLALILRHAMRGARPSAQLIPRLGAVAFVR